MTQVMTGPMGRMAYFDAKRGPVSEYPALNLPTTSFARAEGLIPANSVSAPGVVQLPRQKRRGAAVALFGEPSRRTPSTQKR